MSKKIVYAAMNADILHYGHINILKIASQYGKVIIGLLTNSAIKTYKKTPIIFNYNERKIIVENIKYVHKVVPQKSLSYKNNLIKYKPDFVIHGDDWKYGVQQKTRLEVINTLAEWGGKLIEPKYTKKISSSLIKKNLKY